jgi:hypothetical protein
MLNEVKCSTQIPDVVGLEKETLTVGRHFYLNCEGTWDREFDFSKAFVVLDESTKNTIKVFKIEARNANTFDVDLVLYVAGDIRTTQFKISDGQKEIDLGAQTFKVKSVLPQQTEKPPEPYGYALSQLTWPWQYSAAVLVVFLLILASILLTIAYKMKWRGRMDRLKNYDSPLAADSQFYKEIRKAEKNEFPISELERICKVYILRSYRAPVFELSLRQTISFIKKTHPRLKMERRQIYLLLKDIDVLKKQSDFEKRKKFVEQCYRLIDQTEDLKQRGQL